VKNGVAIDLSKLKSVDVDAKAGTLTIGGRTSVSIICPVYEAFYQMRQFLRPIRIFMFRCTDINRSSNWILCMPREGRGHRVVMLVGFRALTA
jgi:hypothetical protein